MTTTEPAACSTPNCTRPARAAVRTMRPTRPDLHSILYYDNRTAPKTAQPYCRACTVELMIGLCRTLIDQDDEVIPGPRELDGTPKDQP